MAVPYLISRYMFKDAQIGKVMMPIAIDIASLMTKMPGDRSVASEINIVVNLYFLINCIVIIKVYAT